MMGIPGIPGFDVDIGYKDCFWRQHLLQGCQHGAGVVSEELTLQLVKILQTHD